MISIMHLALYRYPHEAINYPLVTAISQHQAKTNNKINTSVFCYISGSLTLLGSGFVDSTRFDLSKHLLNSSTMMLDPDKSVTARFSRTDTAHPHCLLSIRLIMMLTPDPEVSMSHRTCTNTFISLRNQFFYVLGALIVHA